MDYMKNYREWLESPYMNAEGKAELARIADNEKDVEYRFGGELEFGTAGMRGVIGYGMNMMNVYTVKRATQGLSEWVKSLGQEAMERGVVISYDTRRKSEEFAKASAGVLAKNGIKAYLLVYGYIGTTVGILQFSGAVNRADRFSVYENLIYAA